MSSSEGPNVDSRAATVGRKRPLIDSSSDGTIQKDLNSDYGPAQRKRQRETREPDVRDFVPSGGLSGSSKIALGERNDGPHEPISPAEANTRIHPTSFDEETEEGEISDGTAPTKRIPAESPAIVQDVVGISPRVNWNSTAKMKIRTRLGGQPSKAQESGRHRGISKRVSSTPTSLSSHNLPGELPEVKAQSKVADGSSQKSGLERQADPRSPVSAKRESADQVPHATAAGGRHLDLSSGEVSADDAQLCHTSAHDAEQNHSNTFDENLASAAGRDEQRHLTGSNVTNYTSTARDNMMGKDVVNESELSRRVSPGFEVVIETKTPGQTGSIPSTAQSQQSAQARVEPVPEIGTPSPNDHSELPRSKSVSEDGEVDSMILEYSQSHPNTKDWDGSGKGAQPTQNSMASPMHPQYSESESTLIPSKSKHCADLSEVEQELQMSVVIADLMANISHKLVRARASVKDAARPAIALRHVHLSLLVLRRLMGFVVIFARLRATMSILAPQSGAHLGTDCRTRPKTSRIMSGGTTFCYENYQRYSDAQSSLIAISSSHEEFSIRGKARPQPVYYADSDSDDEPTNFLRARVNKDPNPRNHIRFNGEGLSNFSSGRGRESDPYFTRSERHPYEDQNLPPLPSPRGSQARSGPPRKGPSAPPPPPLPPGPPPRRHQPVQTRQSSQPSYPHGDNRGRDVDRWLPPPPPPPPLSREPLQPPPPLIETWSPRGKKGGNRGARNDNHSRPPGGDRDRDTYRPMPSSAKNAWKKHRI
ncbi:MAG: hypothetical protein M1837_000042 [Sclerophora amabilis]|nr:MAG: hypothetical protein M1837_000042 [Sclerophora amabilis]